MCWCILLSFFPVAGGGGRTRYISATSETVHQEPSLDAKGNKGLLFRS